MRIVGVRMMVINEANPRASEDPSLANSQVEIAKRLALGQISWTGPLLLVTSRTVLAVVAQGMSPSSTCCDAPRRHGRRRLRGGRYTERWWILAVWH